MPERADAREEHAMNGPLVTVVMPAFNAEAFIANAIESVLAQDYRPFELIVVDDGSTDRTAEVVRAFPAARYVRQENQGPGAARNTGIRLARGELVANVDADDLVPPWKLSVQVAYLVEHPEVACVLGRQEWIDPPPWLVRDPIYDELDGIPLNSMIVRKSALEELEGHDDSLGGDIDLLVRMRERGFRYVVLPEIVVHRRYHGGNLIAAKPLTTPIPLVSLKAHLDRERTATRAEEARNEPAQQ
jgi:glycosyltransferase involved in cell wall biosynthesis